jgi:hypothetical protein
MKFRGGEFLTGTTGNFQPELTITSFWRLLPWGCRWRSVQRTSSLHTNPVARIYPHQDVNLSLPGLAR